ncbi:MAG: hypothetical protein ABJH98_00490 [Reichenbachiella sp.]|uniref:hypothetical protein n=1 Tax=Reichenbachiella sp. TaxID=2184521 RepID=UPI003298A14A
MEPQEYFAILPLLVYGIAIAELVSPWRIFFEDKKPFIPFILTGIMMLEVAFYNFYQFFSQLENTYQSYFIFLTYLFSPLIFLMAAHVYTPESKADLDIRDYFNKRFKLLMILLSIFVASHFVVDFEFGLKLIVRLVFIAVMLTAAFTRWVWLVYVLLFFRLTYTIIHAI